MTTATLFTVLAVLLFLAFAAKLSAFAGKLGNYARAAIVYDAVLALAVLLLLLLR